MKLVAQKPIQDVLYNLGGVETAPNRYNQIKRTFLQNKEYQIFAEPVISSSGKEINWMTEMEGQILNINQLTPEQQSLTKDLVSLKMKKLFQSAKSFEDASLVEFLQQCIEIPDVSDIFIIRQPQAEDMVVLTQWGFVSDKPGAQKGILDKLINAKRVPMIFNIVFDDGKDTPAPQMEVFFEYEKKKEQYTSNADAQITLDSVKVESYVKAYELDDNEPINIQGFTCYEYGSYLVKVTPRHNMNVRVIYSDNTPIANTPIYITMGSEEAETATDVMGRTTLQKVKAESHVKIALKENGAETHYQNFICKADTEEYLVIVEKPVVETPPPPPPPEKYEMRIKVVDDDGDIVPDADVLLKYDGKKIKAKTDAEGYVTIEDIKPGTQVNVEAKAKKRNKKKDKNKK